ncbi:MAG: twin-arginine translocase subunit TatC [Candidatus Electrothrix sp. AW5]|nr:twin-arginine translocase subunit TatC [Candidatus Electrothrix gigas]
MERVCCSLKLSQLSLSPFKKEHEQFRISFTKYPYRTSCRTAFLPDHLTGSNSGWFCCCLQLYSASCRLVFSATHSSASQRSKSYLYLVPRGLFFYLKLALVAGILLASPVIFHQIWRFIAPGLYQHEKKILVPFSIISSCCFLGGAAFGYFIVFPPAFRFLLSYSSAFLDPMPAVSEYFSLALRLLLAFGAIFELPVFMVFLAKLGIVDAPFLVKNRKYAFLLAFIIAAIVTPTPDVVNQLFMAGPLVVLYEISILAVHFFARKPLKETVQEKGEREDIINTQDKE